MFVLDVRNGISLISDDFSTLKLKRDFLCFLWAESKLLVDCLLSLVGFLSDLIPR